MNCRPGQVSHARTSKSRNDFGTGYPFELLAGGRLVVAQQVLGHVSFNQLPDRKLFSLGRPFAGWIVALRYSCKLDTRFLPRLIRRQNAVPSNDHLTEGRRSSPAASISNEVGLGAGGLNPQAEAPQFVVPQHVS